VPFCSSLMVRSVVAAGLLALAAATAASPSSCGGLLPSLRTQGPSIATHNKFKGNFSECCAMCDQNPKCISWSSVQDERGSDFTCFLKPNLTTHTLLIFCSYSTVLILYAWSMG
jgi:hypothetical protein